MTRKQIEKRLHLQLDYVTHKTEEGTKLYCLDKDDVERTINRFFDSHSNIIKFSALRDLYAFVKIEEITESYVSLKMNILLGFNEYDSLRATSFCTAKYKCLN